MIYYSRCPPTGKLNCLLSQSTIIKLLQTIKTVISSHYWKRNRNTCKATQSDIRYTCAFEWFYFLLCHFLSLLSCGSERAGGCDGLLMVHIIPKTVGHKQGRPFYVITSRLSPFDYRTTLEGLLTHCTSWWLTLHSLLCDWLFFISQCYYRLSY